MRPQLVQSIYLEQDKSALSASTDNSGCASSRASVRAMDMSQIKNESFCAMCAGLSYCCMVSAIWAGPNNSLAQGTPGPTLSQLLAPS